MAEKDNKKGKEELEGMVELVAILKDSFVSLGVEIKRSITNNIQGADQATKDLGKVMADSLQSQFKAIGKKSSEILSNMVKLKTGELASKDVKQQIEGSLKRHLDLLIDIRNAQASGLIPASEAVKLKGELGEKTREHIKELKAQEKAAAKIEDTLGITGKIMKDMEKIPIVGSLIDAKKVTEDMEKAAARGAGKLKTLLVGIGSAFYSIAKSLSSPIALLTSFFGIMKSLFHIALDFNKKIFELANSLGTSVAEATRLNDQFRNIANNSKNLGLDASQVAKTYGEMNEQLGFLVPSTKDFAEALTLIQKRTGASAAQMESLAIHSALSGKSVSESYGSILATAKVEGMRNKIALTSRQVLDGIAKVSKAVLVNFKGNVPALAEAVVRATKLGTSLDNINKQAESLLDFETSIQAQFEAEALTGRELNLERARSLALDGDIAGVMEELANQGVNLVKYGEMNVIQREAFAKAIGLSNEELSKQLVMQALANKLGAVEGTTALAAYQTKMKTVEGQKQINAELTKQEQQDLAKASAAEAFEKTIQRLKDTLGKILQGPVTGIVTKFTEFVNNTKAVEALGNKIKTIFQGIEKVMGSLPTILRIVVGLTTLLAVKSIAVAAAQIMGAGAMKGPIGLIAGGIAAVVAVSYLNGLLSGGGGGTPPISGIPTETIKPMNAQAAAAGSTNTANKNDEIKLHVYNNNIVDGTLVGKSSFRYALNIPGGTVDNSSGKGNSGVTPPNSFG